MKKLSLYMMALLTTAFIGCSEEDYEPSVGPQAYLPESPLAVSDISIASTDAPATINLSDYIVDGEVVNDSMLVGIATVKEGSMPANTVLEAEFEFSRNADFSNSAIIDANAIGTDGRITISPQKLQDAYFNEITKNPAKITLYVRTILYTVTDGTSKVIVGKPGDNYFDAHSLEFTPLNKVSIAPAYYIVGGPNDWANSAAERTIKFQHSGEDVYVDPVFTVIFNASDGDTWFAIGDDAACDAVGNGDWSQLYGIVGGDNEAKEGKLERRSVMGSDNTFKVAAGAKKIRVTINMMEGTFKVEPVNIAEAYYLVGGPGSWSSDKSMKFSHSDKDVFDDPVFSYVFAGSGSEMWFAFGDAEGLDAIDSDVWNKLYGYVPVDGEMAMKGSFEVRSILGADNTFHVDGTAKFYRFTINMAEKTYEITPLNFDPYIYYIGATDGWNNDEPNRQRLALTDESGIYTGFLYCADPNGWGNEFKFQKVAGDWGTEINTGQMTGGITGDFADGGGNFKASAGEGVYFVTLNMATLSINATHIAYMGLTGSHCDWNEGTQMTWNATDYCYEISGVTVNADNWKFRVNGLTDPNWTINLGGDISDLTQGGNNISTVGSTIKLYPTRRTSDKIYCTVE